MRPRTRTSPLVGAVTRERIFKSVLFPAPLRPMMPSTSPRLTSKDTSRRAHSVSSSVGGRRMSTQVAKGRRDQAERSLHKPAPRFLLCADAIHLGEVFDTNRNIRHSP